MYYFIVNPASRSGNGKYVWQKAEKILDQENTEYRVYFTSYQGTPPSWPGISPPAGNA